MKKYILLAGVGFYFATFVTIVLLAWLDPRTTEHFVINVVTGEKVPVFNFGQLSKFREAEFIQLFSADRSNADAATTSKLESFGAYLGGLHNVKFENGKPSNTPDIERGMEVYKKSVCWHCHSQFVRPVEYENRRWGPTAQVGEASWESPHFFATRRVGPDLLREGGFRPDDWHYAHFYNPRFTVPQSIMAPFGNMGEYYVKLTADDRDQLEREILAAAAADPKLLAAVPNDAETGMFDFLRTQQEAYKDRAWVLYKGRIDSMAHQAFPVIRVTPRPTQQILDITAYVQTRGTSIGTTAELADLFNKWAGSPADEALQKEFLALGRKKGFAPGNWRIQPSTPLPTGEPDYVIAPAFAIVLQAGVKSGDASFRDANGELVPVELARQRLRTWRQSVKRGSDLFGKKCVGCHGGLDESGYERFTDTLTLSIDNDYLEPKEVWKWNMVGNGYGPAARFLVPEPRNLTLSAPRAPKDSDLPDGAPLNVGYFTAFKYRSTAAKLPLPRDLFHTIRNGMMPSSMPSWPFFTDWEVWDLVNFVMYIGHDKNSRENKARDGVDPESIELTVIDYYSLPAVRDSIAKRIPIPSVPEKDEAGVAVDLPYLEKRGEELFKGTRNLPGALGKTQCLNCHGIDADGWGEQRAEVINKLGFAPRNLWMGQFKLGSSAEDIYLTLRNGVEGTPMNAQVAQGWSDLDAWSLVYYVRKLARQGVTTIGK